jgi:hypothetical protein
MKAKERTRRSPERTRAGSYASHWTQKCEQANRTDRYVGGAQFRVRAVSSGEVDSSKREIKLDRGHADRHSDDVCTVSSTPSICWEYVGAVERQIVCGVCEVDHDMWQKVRRQNRP